MSLVDEIAAFVAASYEKPNRVPEEEEAERKARKRKESESLEIVLDIKFSCSLFLGNVVPL